MKTFMSTNSAYIVNLNAISLYAPWLLSTVPPCLFTHSTYPFIPIIPSIPITSQLNSTLSQPLSIHFHQRETFPKFSIIFHFYKCYIYLYFTMCRDSSTWIIIRSTPVTNDWYMYCLDRHQKLVKIQEIQEVVLQNIRSWIMSTQEMLGVDNLA